MFKLYQLRAEILQTPLPPPFPFPRPFWLGPPTWRQSWQADILWTISHSHLDAGAGWPLFVPCCGVFRYTFAHNVFRVTTFQSAVAAEGSPVGTRRGMCARLARERRRIFSQSRVGGGGLLYG